uniref:Uncharacterized protein n=1 Tax=Oryzias latipes TaxID=8090 RepID=A0A3P9KNM3_ORYLA
SKLTPAGTEPAILQTGLGRCTFALQPPFFLLYIYSVMSCFSNELKRHRYVFMVLFLFIMLFLHLGRFV